MIPFDKKVGPNKEVERIKTMIRNLKVLGLALGALFAMSAMMASAVSAHTPAVFHVEKTPATITGNQKTTHTFEATSQKITCETVAFEGTIKSGETTPTSVKLAATYDNCLNGYTITGFATDDSEIGNAGKCWYRLDAAGSAALECNGADVTIDAITCIIHIPAQSFASGVTYSTESLAGGIHDLTVSFNFEKVTATHTDGFLCPFSSGGHSEADRFHGTSTATAETDPGSEPVGVTHTPTVP